MEYTLIAAMADNNVIGRENDIPWYLPEDLKLFKDTTMDSVVIMGRNTWESIPERYRPLKGRLNIVISATRYPEVVHEGDEFVGVPDLDTAVAEAKMLQELHGTKVYVIGGESVYQQTIDDADALCISLVRGKHVGDKFFPKIDPFKWKAVLKKEYTGFDFYLFGRNKFE